MFRFTMEPTIGKWTGPRLALLGLSLTLLSGAGVGAPRIDQVVGTVQEGETLTITGSDFTAKAEDKPLLVWRADDGTQPNPELGRRGAWDEAPDFGGRRLTTGAAPGSSAVVRFDHGESEGAALGAVTFDSDQVYLFRRIREDFDIAEDFVVLAHFHTLLDSVTVGQQISGESSGATGYVGAFTPPGEDGRGLIRFKPARGTLYASPPVDFEFGETMSTGTGSVINDEGTAADPTGTLRSFDFRTLQFQSPTDNSLSIGMAQGDSAMSMTPELTGEPRLSPNWQRPKAQQPGLWQREEVMLDTGSVGAADARLRVRSDGVLNLNATFTARDADHPDPYNRIVQSQVPGGAQPESHMDYDMLYVDDSWHRVILCSEPTYAQCSDPEVQLVQTWNGVDGDSDHIGFILRRGSITDTPTGYLYVVNGEGEANSDGYPILLDGKAPPKAPAVTVEYEG